MTRQQVYDALKIAFSKHPKIADEDKDLLMEDIIGALGLGSSELFNGWTIRRVPGSMIKGCRGMNRDAFGYIASKEGFDDQVARPFNGKDAFLPSFKDLLEKIEQLAEFERLRGEA